MLKKEVFPPWVSLHFALIEQAYVQATGLAKPVEVVPFGELLNRRGAEDAEKTSAEQKRQSTGALQDAGAT